MATLYAQNYKAAFITHPPSKMPAGMYDSNVCATIDTYVVTGNEQPGDVVLWGKVPKGAFLIDMTLTHDGIDCANVGMGVAVYPVALGEFVLGNVNESFRAVSNMGLQLPEEWSISEEEAFQLAIYFGATPASPGNIRLICTYTVC